MFNHILIPTDGSTTSHLGCAKAAGLAKAFGSKVTLLNVVDVYPFAGIGAEFAPGQNDYVAAATAVAQQVLAKAEAELALAGVTQCEKKLIEGDAVHDAILSAAEDLGCDLIVMGSHGRHGVEKLLLGSVAQRVLSRSDIPVLVVRG